jgi:ATP-dependent Clp protease ATP-binding subunit ClpA
VREGEGIAAQALSSLDVAIDEVREQVESVVGYGEGTGIQAPFTPRSKKVLELALKESMQLGHSYIGTERLLLGLVRESEGVAARILFNLEVDPDGVRRELVRRLGVGPESDPVDEVESRGAVRSTSFRGWVAGIRVELSLPGPLPVIVDLDYSYRVGGNPKGGPATKDPEALTATIRSSLEAKDSELMEEVVEKGGEVSLRTFPGMREIAVTVSAEPRPGESPISGFSLSAIFRR